jgi:hypothetical protein
LRILEISQPKFDAEWHFHPEWELTWILEGRGRRCVGDFTEPFASGDLVLVGPELPHFWFSEAPFAARSNPQSEDDGYLVGFVWNGLENRSEVWIIDAQKLAEGPVARVILPQRVPHGFHSTWVRQELLDAH